MYPQNVTGEGTNAPLATLFCTPFLTIPPKNARNRRSLATCLALSQKLLFNFNFC